MLHGHLDKASLGPLSTEGQSGSATTAATKTIPSCTCHNRKYTQYRHDPPGSSEQRTHDEEHQPGTDSHCRSRAGHHEPSERHPDLLH